MMMMICCFQTDCVGEYQLLWPAALLCYVHLRCMFVLICEHWSTHTSMLLMFRKGPKTSNLISKMGSGIVSDTELRWFWVSWLDGVIAWGYGDKPGLRELGSYTDPCPCRINFMSVGSWGDTTGHWIIPSEYYGTYSVSIMYSMVRKVRPAHIFCCYLWNALTKCDNFW